jgi:hypothetical protein
LPTENSILEFSDIFSNFPQNYLNKGINLIENYKKAANLPKQKLANSAMTKYPECKANSKLLKFIDNSEEINK